MSDYQTVTKASVNYGPGQPGRKFPHCGDPRTCAMFRAQGNLRIGTCHNPDGSVHVIGPIEASARCKDWTPAEEHS